MKKTKFFGWQQVILLSILYGFGYNMSNSALAISNATMLAGGQVAMTASMYGLSYSLFSLMQGPSQPIVGKLVKKFGPKKILIGGNFLLVLVAFLIPNFISSGITFVIGYGLIFGINAVMINQLAPQTLINNWFHQRLGQAQVLMRAISTTLVVAVPYLTTYVINNFGKGNFKAGWYFAGFGALISMVFSFFLKETPDKYGQTPDGINIELDAKENRKIAATVYKRPIGKDIAYKDAIKMPQFWLMVVVAAIGFMCLMTKSYNDVYHASIGISMENISIAVGVATACNILFMFFISAILDKFEPAFVIGVVFVIFAFNGVLSWLQVGTFIVYTNSILTLLINSSTMTIMPAIYANYFGRANFPQIQGLSLLISGLLSSTTGIIGGYIKDLTGSYAIAYLLYGALALVAAFIAFFLIGVPSIKKYRNEMNQS